jgi:hypothetical protein
MFADKSKLVFFASALIAAFAYGFSAAKFRLFPYNVLAESQRAGIDLWYYWRSYVGSAPTRWLRAARKVGGGVTIREGGLYQDGVTLVSSLFDGDVGLRLINPDGTTFHAWRIRYLDLWNEQEQVALQLRPVVNWDVGLMGAHVFPDASIVFTFNNGGLVKLDKCGHIVWKRTYLTHHSIFSSEDGTLWAPSVKGTVATGRAMGLAPLVPPFIEDTVLQLDSNGSVLREISVPKLMLKNGLESVLLANGVTATANLTDDYTHLNKVTVLQSADAGSFPLFKAGDVLVSLRNLNMVFVFDPNSQLIKWYQVGPWLRQHDPQFTHDGKISVFDNHTDNADGRVFGGSRIVKVDPNTREVQVVYAGNRQSPFYTDIEGEHAYLVNGNLLISESMAGRIFEVDHSSRIVWEFVNRYDEARVVAETNAYGRFAASYFQSVDWGCSSKSEQGGP